MSTPPLCQVRLVKSESSLDEAARRLAASLERFERLVEREQQRVLELINARITREQFQALMERLQAKVPQGRRRLTRRIGFS